MGLKANFSRSDIKRMIQQQAEQRIYQVIERQLNIIGLKFVRNARLDGNYTDRTGNLRSSIGYMVMHNGSVLNQNFQGTSEGEGEGRRIALEVGAEHSSGWVLVVVAGMDYAAAVEARNYDVLTNSSTIAENDLRAFRNDLKRLAV